MEKKYIPNLNTFSALIDRLVIENIKLVNFENRIKDISDGRAEGDAGEYAERCEVQKEIIDLLKEEITALMGDVLKKGKYEPLPEKRTFEK
ncbi:MAG: hypothetical protein PHH49_07415 [Candidatus Omnitrophica bacterium]|nr:hypothetical protein [Candidatus Omnitrophota bacterium]MDD5488763.1 hypothetical protein [Candidatus Omnitrophota bacterium]